MSLTQVKTILAQMVRHPLFEVALSLRFSSCVMRDLTSTHVRGIVKLTHLVAFACSKRAFRRCRTA